MDFAEALWRSEEILRIPQDWLAMRHRFGRDYTPGANRSFTRNYPIYCHKQAPNFDTFRLFEVELSIHQQFDWSKDYKHAGNVPMGFSRFIDLRGQHAAVDIKYIWELNRHQFLSALAFSSNHSAPDLIESHLRSWLLQNPYLVGINWTSSLELALRVISWALLYPTIQGRIDQDAEFSALFYSSVYLHMARIRSRLSRHSSANNHLIGELVGLYVGSKCFNAWPEADKWSHFARNALEREIILQVNPDGTNREQAISYQLFTTELFLLALIVGKNCGEFFSSQYRDRLWAMVNFILDVATPSGELPAFGDSDNARGFLVSMRETSLQVISQLAFFEFGGDERLRRFVPAHPASCLSLFREDGQAQQPATESSHLSSRVREAGGIAVFEGDEAKVLMDFGQLGYTNIAAHGHADALSIQLALGDEYVLIDPGTYAYHSHPEWRAYFRSTAAHNTAVVDSLDQSEMAGRFLWARKAQCRLLRYRESEHSVEIEAEHDGYSRLHDPVIHRRKLAFHFAGPSLLVEDRFSGLRAHDICLHWHAHERAAWSICTPNSATLRFGKFCLNFRISGTTTDLKVFRGSSNPILGWRSRSFDSKEPAPVLRASARVNGETTITTEIQISKP